MLQSLKSIPNNQPQAKGRDSLSIESKNLKEVVPIYSINFPNAYYNGRFTAGHENLRILGKLYGRDMGKDTTNLLLIKVLSNLETSSPGILEKEESLNWAMEAFNKSLDSFINLQEVVETPQLPNTKGLKTYDSLMDQLVNKLYWEIANVSNKFFLVGFGSIFEVIRENGSNNFRLKPIVLLMVKREYIPYIKLSMLNGIMPDVEAFEYWESSDFNIVGGDYSFLKGRFNREIRTPLLATGFNDFKIKDNFYEDLFVILKIPREAKATISGVQDWAEQVVQEAVDSRRVQEEVSQEVELLIE